MKKIKALSLFANVGIAETYLEELGITVVCANEIDNQRVAFYKHLYPNVDMIAGDITLDETKDALIKSSLKHGIDLIIATPPCQGMSTAGKHDKNDIRNSLICHAVDIIKKLNPKYVFLENVPEQLTTKINHNGESIPIPEYLELELGQCYTFNDQHLVNACDYGVPQSRERAIFLLTRRDLNKTWSFPQKNNTVVSLEQSIGDLPSLDPEIKDVSEKKLLEIFPDFYKKKAAGLKISKWFYPPKHVYRQVYSLMHTPTGKTAFDNIDLFKPKKADGSFVKGFKNTYKRQEWTKPAYTVTMYNRTIGSQNNVHPGRYIG
ncbi:MAG: DNA cytosine methyltransferase, partial [Clostridia bacterium]|nr:DNA cytosine methyltransferase [Clostridia bacterium]